MGINKKYVIASAAAIWILFSLAYIAFDIWDDFKKEQLSIAFQSGYQQGVSDAVSQALSQAENEKCEPFSIYNKEKRADVINTACLKQANSPENGDKK